MRSSLSCYAITDHSVSIGASLRQPLISSAQRGDSASVILLPTTNTVSLLVGLPKYPKRELSSGIRTAVCTLTLEWVLLFYFTADAVVASASSACLP